jgi:hypothetical protein
MLIPPPHFHIQVFEFYTATIIKNLNLHLLIFKDFSKPVKKREAQLQQFQMSYASPLNLNTPINLVKVQ